MTLELPTCEPRRITMGETVEFEIDLDDFPADEGWTLTYYFRSRSANGIDVTATADGTTHKVSMASTVTDDLSEGDYFWQAWVTKDAEKYIVREGNLQVVKGLNALQTSANYDPRSQAEKILNAIDDLMVGKAAQDNQRYLIATGVPGFSSQREAERIDPEQLLKLREYYAGLVRSQKRRKKRSTGYRNIPIQFDRP